MSRVPVLVLFAVLSTVIGLSACGNTPREEGANPADEAGWIPGLEGVKSGEIEAFLTMHGTGAGGQVSMRVLGSFLGAGEDKLPWVHGSAEAAGRIDGEKVDFSAALITSPHRATVSYEGNVYEMDAEAYDPVRSSFERTLGDGTAADMYACLEAAAGIDLGQIGGRTTERDPNATADDKTKVTTVTTELKPSTLSGALDKLTEDPGCGAQLNVAAPLRKMLDGVARTFEGGLKEGEIETFVDKSGLLREMRAKAILDSNGKGQYEAEFVYSVSHVNEIKELPPGTGEKPIAILFHKLGFNPLRAIEAGAPGLVGLLEGIYARALA